MTKGVWEEEEKGGDLQRGRKGRIRRWEEMRAENVKKKKWMQE